jgi:hypothetical protein
VIVADAIASIIGLRHYGRVSSAIYSIVDNQNLDEVLALIINNIINRLAPLVLNAAAVTVIALLIEGEFLMGAPGFFPLK